MAHELRGCEDFIWSVPECGFAGEEELQAVFLESCESSYLPFSGRFECGRVLGCLDVNECSFWVAPL